VVEAATAENAIEILRGAPVDGVLCAARASGWSCAAVVSLARAAGLRRRLHRLLPPRERRRRHRGAARNGADAYVVLPDDPGAGHGGGAARAGEAPPAPRGPRPARPGPRPAALHRQRARGLRHRRGGAPRRPHQGHRPPAGRGRHRPSLVAEMIHEASPRRDRPFVRAGCAGLSETLLDVRLFGQRGRRAGRPRRREGLIERADGGTLYLHEVASLGPSLQVKLLRRPASRPVRACGRRAHPARRRAGGGLHPASTSARRSAPAASATTSTTGSTWSRSRCRRCAPARDIRRSPPTSSPSTARRSARRCAAHPRRAARPCSPTSGRETCASWRTPWPAAALACRGRPGGYRRPAHRSSAAPAPTRAPRSALIPGASLFEIEREAILRTLDVGRRLDGPRRRGARRLGPQGPVPAQGVPHRAADPPGARMARPERRSAVPADRASSRSSAPSR